MSQAATAQRRKGATPVSRYLQGITAEAMRRFGFANSAIIANWTEIAGQAIAAYAVPIKLTGGAARQKPERGDEAVASAAQGATLLLRVDPARSLEIQYLIPQLIERINACVGYRAVTVIRMVQVPIAERRAQPRRVAPPAGEAHARDATRLDRALARLAEARTVQTRRNRETTGSRNLA